MTAPDRPTDGETETVKLSSAHAVPNGKAVRVEWRVGKKAGAGTHTSRWGHVVGARSPTMLHVDLDDKGDYLVDLSRASMWGEYGGGCRYLRGTDVTVTAEERITALHEVNPRVGATSESLDVGPDYWPDAPEEEPETETADVAPDGGTAVHVGEPVAPDRAGETVPADEDTPFPQLAGHVVDYGDGIKGAYCHECADEAPERILGEPIVVTSRMACPGAQCDVCHAWLDTDVVHSGPVAECAEDSCPEWDVDR